MITKIRWKRQSKQVATFLVLFKSLFLPQTFALVKYSKEIKVGLFAVVGILLLIAGYNFLKGFNPLSTYNKYYVVYDNVNGIVKSTQVTINGLKVGQVQSIGMLENGDPTKLLVTLFVESSIKLPFGTTAAITSQGLLGSTDIVIVPAEGTSIYQNKDTLVAKYEESLQGAIQKIVDPIKEKSEKVLITLDNMLNSMNKIFDSTGSKRLESSIDDFSGTMKNMRNITARFDKLTADEYASLKGMLENINSITHNLKANNESIAKALKNIGKITDSIAASDLSATINHTRDVMKTFNTTLEKVNRGEGSLGKLANDTALYNHIDKTTVELQALLKDMQEYPGRYFSVSVFGGAKRATKESKKREADKNRK
jgi:phospholipid/cholesterol/gamma-HCH transport system substrate-binding protein